MVLEPPRVPVIEEITIVDSTDDDEALPSNNVAINKENTPENPLSTEYYNCDTFREDCDSTLFHDENPTGDPLADIKISEPYSLDEKINGDFIILGQEKGWGMDSSTDDDDNIIYMETENDEVNYKYPVLSNVNDEEDHNSSARSNLNNKVDHNKRSPNNINDKVDHNASASSNISDEDSEKELCIDEDAEPPDDNDIHDTNVTDKSVLSEKKKSLSNENATAEKKEATTESSVNEKKKADDSEVNVDKDSDDSQKNSVLEPKNGEPTMKRLCIQQLLIPYCCTCKGPGDYSRTWFRQLKTECFTCGTNITYFCKTCSFSEKSMVKAVEHVKGCTSKILWRCYKCTYANLVKEQVEIHITYAHKTKANKSCDRYLKDKRGRYLCSVCRKGFKSPSYMYEHERFCGVERCVRIVGLEDAIKTKRPRKSRKKKDPEPSVVEEVKGWGMDSSTDDADSITYMETEDDEVNYKYPVLSNANDKVNHNSSAPSNLNDKVDHNKRSPNNINDKVDHNASASSNISDEDSEKELCIDEDAEPPDDNDIHDTNVTDKSVLSEKKKSLSNENATAEKKEATTESSVNEKKKADGSEMDVDEDSDDSQKNSVLEPKNGEPTIKRLCIRQLLIPHCSTCRGPGNARNWFRRLKSDCATCGTNIAYFCKTCGFFEESMVKAVEHVRGCTSKMLWRCYKCSYANLVKERVKLHVTYAHKNKENKSCDRYLKDRRGKFLCPICRRAFMSPAHVYKHERCCGIERYVRIVGLEEAIPLKKIKLPPKKKDPEPSVVEEVKGNADDYIKLHCCKCKLTFEKGRKEKKCDKCETALLWQCVRCSTVSKSYCGLYDHVNNCTNELTQLIFV